jgi:hypothetical protein
VAGASSGREARQASGEEEEVEVDEEVEVEEVEVDESADDGADSSARLLRRFFCVAAAAGALPAAAAAASDDAWRRLLLLHTLRERAARDEDSSEVEWSMFLFSFFDRSEKKSRRGEERNDENIRPRKKSNSVFHAPRPRTSLPPPPPSRID